ncbi:MAG: hypothetical protein U1E01_08455, partial [Methylicorpusculum sp.]|nr:hypothetical protein [Methylicorpusculum sp.]
QIFVAVLGASNYTYAEATWSQSLPDWIGSHQRCFTFLGGVPELVVPDYVPGNIIKTICSQNSGNNFSKHITDYFFRLNR